MVYWRTRTKRRRPPLRRRQADGGEIGRKCTVGKGLHGFEDQLTGHTRQDFGAGGVGLCHHIKIMEAAIPHQQHPWTYRTQQPKTTMAFADMTGPETGIGDGMGAALHQVDPFHLGKSTVPTVAVMPSKGCHIRRGVSHIFHCAVDRHQAQPKQKCPRRFGRGQRAADLMKQRCQRARPQLIPPIAQRTGPCHHILRVRPDIAQPFAHFAHRFALRQVAVDMLHNEQQDGPPYSACVRVAPCGLRGPAPLGWLPLATLVPALRSSAPG